MRVASHSIVAESVAFVRSDKGVEPGRRLVASMDLAWAQYPVKVAKSCRFPIILPNLVMRRYRGVARQRRSAFPPGNTELFRSGRALVVAGIAKPTLLCVCEYCHQKRPGDTIISGSEIFLG